MPTVVRTPCRPTLIEAPGTPKEVLRPPLLTLSLTPGNSEAPPETEGHLILLCCFVRYNSHGDAAATEIAGERQRIEVASHHRNPSPAWLDQRSACRI